MATVISINCVLRIDAGHCHGLYRTLCQHPGAGVHFLGFIKAIGPDCAIDNESERSLQRKEAADVSPEPDTFVDRVVPTMKRTAVGTISMVPSPTLIEWLESGQATVVQIVPLARQTLPLGRMTAPVQSNTARRLTLIEPFMDSQNLANALVKASGLGPLVRQVISRGCSRATAYRLWGLLCTHGFDASAVVAAFDMCGALGQSRPIAGNRQKAGRKTLGQRLGISVENAQRGLTEKDRQIIVRLYRIHQRAQTSQRKVYDQIIQNGYVQRYEQTASGLKPVMPEKGSFPNARQVRHVISTEVGKLERVRRLTTQGHFDRNLRGLRGNAFDGVSGPGHTYAIDSTIADLYLRSSINRSWLLGRPIVYVMVDVWSTAVVGFYLCLSWPSWATAKVALFSTMCNPTLLSELWGFGDVGSLNPSPSLPFRLLCDRGEYLSQGARETGIDLGLNAAFNPAYRPDLKGLVEVLHRIVKDEQYRSFVPGAMDARRKELELRPNVKESALTMREYAQYLHLTFTQYNLFADRSHRLTGDMIAAGVAPSPAGLWRFGHEAGFGYLKQIPEARLITSLLPMGEVMVRRNGVYMAQLQYQSEVASELQWTAEARNFGAIEQHMHHFPGSVSRLWWPNPNGGLDVFNLTPGARTVPETVLDEWVDALTAQKLKRNDQIYGQLVSRLALSTQTNQLFEGARQATKDAELKQSGAVPAFREVRRLEGLLGPADELASDLVPVSGEAHSGGIASLPQDPDPYETCKQELLRQLNQEGPIDGQ